MSKKTKRSIWTFLARKLVRRGRLIEQAGLARRDEMQSLRRTASSLRAKTLGTWPWKESDGTILPVPHDEQSLFAEVFVLRKQRLHSAAIRMLDKNAHLASRQDEVRVAQAWLAYERHWDTDAMTFLEAAVAAAQPQRTTLYWGPVAIISNSYWSRAMNEGGLVSKTLMWDVAPINKRTDFDLYPEDIMPSWMVFKDRAEMFSAYGALSHMLAFLHLIRHASVVHMPATGSMLGQLRLWNREAQLFRLAGVKTIMMPYGGDYYCYSRVQDPSVRHGLLANYPQLARKESDTQARLTYWQQEADAVLCGFMVDAMGRWDVTTFCFFHIDTALWQPKQKYSDADGRNAPVRILHTPNHRGFKGTEFLIKAVEELKHEGLQVELQLLEKVPNTEVRRLMQECDILAEQFIATAYAMSGMEGMASGLPVMANLHDEYYTRHCRRYSFLNECPILSTTPEILKENLRILITKPALREALGRAGREYVEKYHSFGAARYLFGKIYDRILHGKEVDLVNLYHPLLSDDACNRPKVSHPLVENRLPKNAPFLT